MAVFSERFLDGVCITMVRAYELAADLTDYLDPKVTPVTSPIFTAHFKTPGFREVKYGPLSGSVALHETRLDEHLDMAYGSYEKRPILRLRRRIHRLFDPTI